MTMSWRNLPIEDIIYQNFYSIIISKSYVRQHLLESLFFDVIFSLVENSLETSKKAWLSLPTFVNFLHQFYNFLWMKSKISMGAWKGPQYIYTYIIYITQHKRVEPSLNSIGFEKKWLHLLRRWAESWPSHRPTHWSSSNNRAWQQKGNQKYNSFSKRRMEEFQDDKLAIIGLSRPLTLPLSYTHEKLGAFTRVVVQKNEAYKVLLAFYPLTQTSI